MFFLLLQELQEYTKMARSSFTSTNTLRVFEIRREAEGTKVLEAISELK